MTPDPDAMDAIASGDLSAAEVSRIAVQVLDAIPFPALVLEVPSERIVASSPAAARLLDPGASTVVGHLLAEFTTDRSSTGHELFAAGRLNGLETLRDLRRDDGADLRIRMWIRSFDHQPASRFVVAVIIADRDSEDPPGDVPAGGDEHEGPAVLGLADAGLSIERISSDAEALFDVSGAELLHRSLLTLVAEDDVARCLSALSESCAAQNGITTDVRVRAGRGPAATRCELLLLPLKPAPSCVFVFMPIPESAAGRSEWDTLSASLLRLRRGAGIAHLAPGAFRGPAAHALPDIGRLTSRELEIVTHLLDGQRPPAIARTLFLSQSTIRNHLGSVYAKLGVTSQQQLLDLLRAG